MARVKRKKPAFPALEWIDEAAGKQLRIVLAGGRRALIENHMGIVEFSEERVRLMTRGGVMAVAGKALTLSEVRATALTVRGTITAIELPDGGEPPDA